MWNINAFPAGFWIVPAPEGSQVAFVSNAPAPGTPATISQVLSVNQLSNTNYTLTGFVGAPIDFSVGTVWTVDLLAGATLLTTITGTPPAGTFFGFTAIFTSTAAGGPLTIRLSSNQAQLAFDNIRLDASPLTIGGTVPEPASLLLLGGGLGVLARNAGRRRRK